MTGLETNLLLNLTKQCFFHRFTVIDPSLRKLPGARNGQTFAN